MGIENDIKENALNNSAEDSERTSRNAESESLSEAIQSAVKRTVDKKTKDGRVIGVNKGEARMTAKMRCFASGVAQGLSPREAYIKAYDTRRMGDATIISEANRLMRDHRINTLLEHVWESVEQNIIDDAIATRRKIMGELLKHADDDKARLGDRLKSLELMGRAIGMFTDKSEVKTEAVDTEQLKRELDEHLHKFGKPVH